MPTSVQPFHTMRQLPTVWPSHPTLHQRTCLPMVYKTPLLQRAHLLYLNMLREGSRLPAHCHGVCLLWRPSRLPLYILHQASPEDLRCGDVFHLAFGPPFYALLAWVSSLTDPPSILITPALRRDLLLFTQMGAIPPPRGSFTMH